MNWSDYFYYDETSPSYLRAATTRLANSHIHRVVVSKGDVVGYKRKDGYWVVKLFGKGYKVHRIVYELHNEPLGNKIIDHIDGDKSNNSIENLRSTTDYFNAKNKSKYSNNSTGVSGIHINEKSIGNFYYVATWREADKKIGAKSFSWNKFGKEEAFKLAVEFREAKLRELLDTSVGYTERHGK